jgi:hypothetical protein
MKHSEEYCHCNKKVLLEECIHSIRNNIWCYPTSRVFSISCVQYLVNGLDYSCCVNVLNLHIIDLARKYHTHLQREIEKEEAREKEWKNSH